MDKLEEFVSIDSQFYKIIESWDLLEDSMRKEYELMVQDGDKTRADAREVMLNSLDKIVEICRDQRICLAHVAKEYNINVSEYDGPVEKFDPIDVLIRVFEDNYFKSLCDSLDRFIEVTDTDGKFEKKTYTTETSERQN